MFDVLMSENKKKKLLDDQLIRY